MNICIQVCLENGRTQIARWIVAVSRKNDEELKSVEMGGKGGLCIPSTHTYIKVNDLCIKNNPLKNKVTKVSYLTASVWEKKLPNFKYFENSLRNICPPIRKISVRSTTHKITSTIQLWYFLVTTIKDTHTFLVYTYFLPHYVIVNLNIPNHCHYVLRTYHM